MIRIADVYIEMTKINFALIRIWGWSSLQDGSDKKRCRRSFRHGFLMMVHLACAHQCVDTLIAATGEQLRPSVSSNYAIIGTTDDCPAITMVGFLFAISWAWAKLTTMKIWKIEDILEPDVYRFAPEKRAGWFTFYIFMRRFCTTTYITDKHRELTSAVR